MFQREKRIKSPGRIEVYAMTTNWLYICDQDYLCKTRVLCRAEFWRDHSLICTILKLVMKGKDKSTNVSLPKILNDSSLKEKKLLKETKLQENYWFSFLESIYKVGIQALALLHKNHQNWFDQNKVIEEWLVEHSPSPQTKTKTIPFKSLMAQVIWRWKEQTYNWSERDKRLTCIKGKIKSRELNLMR